MPYWKHGKAAALPLLICCAPDTAIAGSLNSLRFEPEVKTCIQQAAQGKPWLEKTLWGLRDQEAGWVGADIINANGTHDLGVLQINSAWVPKLAGLIGRPVDQVYRWLRFDACFNAQAARWIFLFGLGQTQDFWKAVGVYHSPTPFRQKAYAASVVVHMRRRFGNAVFARTAGNPGEYEK